MKNIHALILVLTSSALLWSCTSNEDIPVAKDPQMIKLTAPVIINLDSTNIVLSDYLLRPHAIDSFSLDPMLNAAISADSSVMIIKPVSRDFPRLSELRIWSEGYPYSILLERTSRVWFRFVFDPGTKRYREVMVKGQMNDWTPSRGRMTEKDGKWQIDLHLYPGKYQYKLIVDGKETSDPTNRDSVSNGMGGYNSLITLGNLNSPNLPYLYTSKNDGQNITIGMANKADTVFVLWQNHLLDQRFWRRDTSGIHIALPRKARDFDRSYIRIWAVNSLGISNLVMVPLAKGKVLTDPAGLKRSDREAMILYFLMVDRFRNGNKTNDAPVDDPQLDPKVNYMGGDLAGISQAIRDGYFSGLGVNTLWISPITQNPVKGYVEFPPPHRKFSGYHGYWPVTLTTVDTRFGTPDEMHDVVDQAHDAGMNILLDFVSHHAHEDYPVFKDHPDWVTPLELPGKRKNIRIWDEQRLTTWFDTFLPTFDLTKPEVAEMVSDSALFWITTYQFDGFRHDAAKHIPENYWRMLTSKLNEKVAIPDNRMVYQIGETFGSRDLIASYINPGMLDAQFEFNLYWEAKAAFATENYSFRDLNYALQQSFSYFGEHNLMGNITGNQDMTRFISYASGAVSFSENDVEAGWKRDIQVKDTIGYRRLALLQAFNMTIPGVPVIYYGDEFGMPGAGDPDNRRMMRFDSLDPHESALKAVTGRLARLRSTNLPLIYGDFRTLKVNENQFVYMRSYFDKTVIVILNKDRSPRKVEFTLPGWIPATNFKANFGSATETTAKGISVSLQGVSFEILTN